MKKIVLIMLFVCFYSNAQENFMFKCKDIVQRDSISNDLKIKGYKAYNCEVEGLYVNLQTDHTFCFSTSLKGHKEVSIIELYSTVIVKEPTEPLESYLTDTDPFNGQKTYKSWTSPVSFTKVKSKASSTQYVSVSLEGSTLNYKCEGVYILFENGEKIARIKEKVDTGVSSGGWYYTAFFIPTANEVKLLKTQKIIAAKLYIYKKEDISESTQNTILEDAKNILTIPKPKKKH